MNKTLSRICGAGLTLSLLLSTSVLAQPQSRPNGPWVQDSQNLSFSSLMTNEQLYEKLQKMAKSSQGRMTLEVAGYSKADYDDPSSPSYPLYVAKFGENKPENKKVLITSQIHGNEVLTTEAAVELMQKLSAGGKDVAEILDKVTVWFMPRINPSGTMNIYEGSQYPTRYTLHNWVPVRQKTPISNA